MHLKLQCSHCNTIFVLAQPHAKPTSEGQAFSEQFDFESQARAEQGSLDGIEVQNSGPQLEQSPAVRQRLPTSGLGIASSAIGMLGFVIAGVGIFMMFAEAGGRFGTSRNNASCPMCGREFHIPDEHRGTIAQITREYRCPNCGVSFPAIQLYQAYEDRHGAILGRTNDSQILDTPGFYVLGGGLCLGGILAPIGLILGVCAFMQRGRSHWPSLLGIVLNAISLLIFLFIYFLGTDRRERKFEKGPTFDRGFEGTGNKIGAAGS